MLFSPSFSSSEVLWWGVMEWKILRRMAAFLRANIIIVDPIALSCFSTTNYYLRHNISLYSTHARTNAYWMNYVWKYPPSIFVPSPGIGMIACGVIVLVVYGRLQRGKDSRHSVEWWTQWLSHSCIGAIGQALHRSCQFNENNYVSLYKKVWPASAWKADAG